MRIIIVYSPTHDMRNAQASTLLLLLTYNVTGADDVTTTPTGNYCTQLRTPVFIPEVQESQDEIRAGLWEEGEFVEVRRSRMWLVDGG